MANEMQSYGIFGAFLSKAEGKCRESRRDGRRRRRKEGDLPYTSGEKFIIMVQTVKHAAGNDGGTHMNRKYMIPLLSTFVLWGSLYIVSKIALKTIPPVTLLALRYMVSIPALFAILALRGALRRPTGQEIRRVLAIGAVGYFMSFCLQMLGISRLTGSVSSLLGAMNPVFIPVLAAVFLKERLTRAKVVSVAVSMAGVAAIVGVRGTADATGVALMLSSVFLWSAASVMIRWLGGRLDPMQVAMMAMIFALPMTLAWSAIELRTSAIAFTRESVLAVLYMGLAGTAAAHSLWNWSLSKMDASFCSMFYPLQPLVSAVLGVLLLGERVTGGFLTGAALICCGIVAAVRSGAPKKR